MIADSTSPEPDEPETKGIERDKHGDPVLQGTRMKERESYERVIDGLKIAAEAAAHMAFSHHEFGDAEAGIRRAKLAITLDKVRMRVVNLAGIEDRSRHHGTQEIRRNPMTIIDAVKRFNYGIKQASGGASQMATCYRDDQISERLAMASVSRELADLERKTRTPKRSFHPHLH